MIEMTMNFYFYRAADSKSMVSWSRKLSFAGYDRVRTTLYASELSHCGQTDLLEPRKCNKSSTTAAKMAQLREVIIWQYRLLLKSPNSQMPGENQRPNRVDRQIW